MTASTTRDLRQRYDALPYPGRPVPTAHPDHLGVLAQLFGVPTAPADRCRVLELGCGEGGNLIPVAEVYPEAEFVGVDLSSHQIERGAAAISELGLTNIELRHLDLLDFDDSFGRFDYIVCHGVFSWVPPPIQSKILDICRDNAAPGCVSYISYNTYPGWYSRGLLRKLMLEGVDVGWSLTDQVAVAREILTNLMYDVDAESSFGSQLRGLAEAVLREGDAYIAHEYLAPINDPMYHREFVARAAAHGLRWLGDQRVSANPSLLGHALLSVDPGDPVRQEYNDVVSDGSFRGAVLCRADAMLRPELVPLRLREFRVSTSLIAPKTLDLEDGVPAAFTGLDVRDNTITLESDAAAMKAALKHLARTTGSLSFAELVDAVESDLARRIPKSVDWDVAALLTKDLHALRAFHANEAVEFLSAPYEFTRELSERPRVSDWARREASLGTKVTNRKNLQVDVSDPIRRFLVQRLDGTRTVEDLVAEVIDESAQGNMVIERNNGKPMQPGREDAGAVRVLVEDRLASFARNALLIA